MDLDPDVLWAQANNTNAAKAGVQKRAANVATRARRELARAKIDATVKVVDHPLASGRTAKDVAVTASDPKTLRRAQRIVRRAAREVRR